MLRRKPTRIELKPEDKQEYTQAKKLHEQQQAQVKAGEGEEGHFDREVGTQKLMEIEVKLRLGDAGGHARVAELLAPQCAGTFLQENFFFDGASAELSSRMSVLRLRFFNQNERAVLTLKGKSVVVDGIATASENEEDLNADFARTFISDPAKLVTLESNLMKYVTSAFEVDTLVCLGGFRNKRMLYNWNGHKIELDETFYDFGTLYELECETERPEELKKELEDWLQQHDVQYQYSTTTKFARFVNKTLD